MEKSIEAASGAREMAKHAVEHHEVNIALACRTFGVSQICYRYKRKRDGGNAQIADRLVHLTSIRRFLQWRDGLYYKLEEFSGRRSVSGQEVGPHHPKTRRKFKQRYPNGVVVVRRGCINSPLKVELTASAYFVPAITRLPPKLSVIPNGRPSWSSRRVIFIMAGVDKERPAFSIAKKP